MVVAAMKSRALVLTGVLFAATPAAADNIVTMTLSDHTFSPTEIHVRANTPTIVTLSNTDADRAVFDSVSLKAKRVAAAHATVTMRWRALTPGTYPFTEEFHSKTAHGVVIAE